MALSYPPWRHRRRRRGRGRHQNNCCFPKSQLAAVRKIKNDFVELRQYRNFNASYNSLCIRTCPNASERVRMGPAGSEHIRKLRKTCKNFEKFTKFSKQILGLDMAIYFLFFGQKPTHGNFFGLEISFLRVSHDSRRFIFRRQNFFRNFFGLEISFFGFFAMFWGSWAKMDVTGRFLAIFCSR